MTGPWEDYTAPSDVAAMVTSEAQRQGVPPDLALRVATQESGLRHGAVSPKGAIGVMQLEPGTAQQMGVDPTDLQQNIQGGVGYLKKQLDTFRDPRLAAAAYNAGPGAVMSHGGVPPYPETQKYVDAVAPQAAQGGPWEDYGGASAPAQSAAPQMPPPAPAASPAAPQPPQTSQALGFLKGAFAPVDHASNWLKSGIEQSSMAPALSHLGAGLNHVLPQGLVDFVQNPQGYYDAKAKAGVVPGKWGEFGGNVASTAWLPGGPAINGALTGAALSNKTDAPGVLGDALMGSVGGKLGSSVVKGVGHAISGVTDPMVQLLASKGVPLTVGQMAGGLAHNLEDKLTSVPLVGDMIRNAQREGLAGVQKAAYNDTLGKIGDQLPDGIALGHDAYNYTKKSLGDAYDAVLQPLTVQKDAPFNQAITAAKAAIKKIGDPSTATSALGALKSAVETRFDKTGQMTGEALKAAQSELGKHINALGMDASPTAAWSGNAADALKGVKTAVEDLVSRTSPMAGEALSKVNSAYSLFKPLEAATKSAAVDGREGQFTLNQLSRGVAKGKSASTLASGNAPHQDLANAARAVLPSTIPDSGTAGRTAATMLAGALLGGGHLPVVGPAAIPLGAALLGGSALYSKVGQKAATVMATARNDATRKIGQYVKLLGPIAGNVSASATRLVDGLQ